MATEPVRDPSLGTSGGTAGMTPPSPEVPSVLSQLEQDYEKKQEQQRASRKKYVTYPFPGLDGWEMRYRTSLPFEKLQLLTAQAMDELPGGTGTNFRTLGILLMMEQMDCFIYHGEEVNTDGGPMTYASPALQRLAKANDTQSCIISLHSGTDTGNPDPVLVAMARALMSDCGYAEGVRPTQR